MTALRLARDRGRSVSALLEALATGPAGPLRAEAEQVSAFRARQGAPQ